MLPTLPGPRRADAARSGSGCGGSVRAVAGLGMEALKHKAKDLGKKFFLHEVNFVRGVAAGREGGVESGWSSSLEEAHWPGPLAENRRRTRQRRQGRAHPRKSA